MSSANFLPVKVENMISLRAKTKSNTANWFLQQEQGQALIH